MAWASFATCWWAQLRVESTRNLTTEPQRCSSRPLMAFAGPGRYEVSQDVSRLLLHVGSTSASLGSLVGTSRTAWRSAPASPSRPSPVALTSQRHHARCLHPHRSGKEPGHLTLVRVPARPDAHDEVEREVADLPFAGFHDDGVDEEDRVVDPMTQWTSRQLRGTLPTLCMAPR